MKIDFKSLRKIFRGEFHKSHLHVISPEQDWKFIVLSFFVLALLLGALSTFLFFKINKGEIFNTEQKVQGEGSRIDSQKLSETVGRFEAKKANLLEFEQNKKSFPDPSL